ncbi:DUF2188 domain-containing protein [Methanobacterium sp. YSL]|nr:DUF2188 domain-containing protein [Methanobacterium sp. YSL]
MWRKFWIKLTNQTEPVVIKDDKVKSEAMAYQTDTQRLNQEVYIVEPVLEDMEEIEDDLEVVKEPVIQEKAKVNIPKYHVSQNKDKDAENFMKWRVRKESSNKTIQYFDTQKLAIDHAQDLALRAGSTVVIHKLDGSIRRQDYTKK